MPLVSAATPPSYPRGYDIEVVDVTGDTTITENHRDRLLRVNSGSNVTLTLPNNLPFGFHFEVEQYGAGQVIFSAASLATLNGASSFDRTRAQYSRARVYVSAQSAINGVNAVYNLSGDVTDSSGTTVPTATATSINATNYRAHDGTAAMTITDSTGAVGITTTVNASGTVNITGGDTNVTTSSASTDGGTSVEPFLVSTTMTGAGGVGGRMRSLLTVDSALGGWSNAIKGEATYGASGKTTGLGSAVLAEMTLSAGTVDGTYAPLEIELNLGSGASTGTATSLVYASVNGADAATFDANGTVLSIQGLTAGDGDCFQTGNTLANAVATLKIKVGATIYYLPLYDGQITTV